MIKGGARVEKNHGDAIDYITPQMRRCSKVACLKTQNRKSNRTKEDSHSMSDAVK